MTDDTDRVLASIDEAIDGYVTWDGDSADALSWEANPVEPFDETAWLEGGHLDGDDPDDDVQTLTINVDLMDRSATWPSNWPAPDPEAAARAVRAIGDAMRTQFDALKSAFASFGKMVTKTVEANHPSFARMTMGDDYRRHRRTCRLCNPAGNPKPLPGNGAEYRRRTRARRRRNRR